MRVEHVGIRAISVAVPRRRVRCSDFGELFGVKEVSRIVASSGISELRIVEEGQTASDLCAEAALPLLENRRDGIRAVVFVSQTPDYILPATGAALQHRLGLPQDIVAYDVSSGCTGYLHGLSLASMLSSASGGDVLLCAGDAISGYVSERDRSLRLIMGDAGSATLVGPSEGSSLPFRFYTDGSRGDALIIPAGASRTPATEENAIPTERENGNWRSDRHLFMDGMGIMRFALSDVSRLVKETLNETKEAIDTHVFHQANKFIVDALTKNLKLPPESVPLAVDGYGNTGPASIPLALCHAFADGGRNPGRTLLAGFGVGLSAATVVADLSRTAILPVLEAGSRS